MKKEEARDLQQEITTLFKPQQHQQSISPHSEQNLLDSCEPSQQHISGTFRQLSLNEGNDDFLQQIDRLIDDIPEDYQPTRREIMLNFKLNELKLICKELKCANQQLTLRIEEMEKTHSQMEANNSIELNGSQDLTMMQQDFSEIEEQLVKYRQELTKYHQKMDAQLTAKNEQIRKAKQQVNQLRHAVDAGERQSREKAKAIGFLQEQNQELLLMVEELQANQPSAINSINDSSFDERISQEMQVMIDKLMKELKYEKRNNAKQLCQIRRLNSEIIILENKLKEKNNKIYQLQLAAIKQNKQQHRNIPKGSTSRVNTDKDEQYNAQTHRNFMGTHMEQPNKNKFQPFINKNRICAQREASIMTKPVIYGSFLPSITVLSTFTLMDILNKQFKIRTIQKYLICSRVVYLYGDKLSRADYNNLIPEEIQIFNFSPQSPAQLQARAIPLNLNRSDRFEANEANLLYNMGFILDSLLNQVEVVDAYRATTLQLNIPDYIELVLSKPSKQEKQKTLMELASSIQREYLSG